MKAFVTNKYGPPDVLELQDVENRLVKISSTRKSARNIDKLWERCALAWKALCCTFCFWSDETEI